MSESSKKTGTVFLVGAGPGDPDLFTVKGTRLLEQCDVVVCDNLVPDELIATLPAETERLYVGKKANRHSLPQDQINALLVKLASDGKTVVRLKGGDPFVFGRGGEEAQYLREHGIPFEIVPGVTSGVAAPAYAGIPCTDRRKASLITFVTGHRAATEDSPEVPWEWLGKTRSGTLVLYMGVAEIESIVNKLLDSGMAPDTPAAAIERGTLPSQRVISAQLSELPTKVTECKIRPPALFVIGETVTLQETLHWFEDKPLFGKRVLVTRPADQAQSLYQSLRNLGAEVLPFPTIATKPTLNEAAWKALRNITADKRWLVFTSENGVRYFLNQWLDQVGDVRGLAAYSIAAVGAGTARALKERSLTADFIPTKATTAAFAKQMSKQLELSDTTIVRVRGNLADMTVEDTLSRTGAEVVPIETYETYPVVWTDEIKKKLSASPPDVVLFTSGSTVNALASNLTEEERQKLFAKATVVSIGPSTSEVIRSHGIPVTLEAGPHTIPDMISELVAYVQS